MKQQPYYFLFTDIEGSTRLWEEQTDAMRVALRWHDEILRRAIEAHSGRVVKTIGDAFHGVFPTPEDGVRATYAAQMALADTTNTPLPLKVRMGLHCGDAEPRDGDYYGPTLNRLARLLSLAHGGQIIISGAMHTALASSVLPNIIWRDLGWHRLRDLQAQERVYQLIHPDLLGDFPELRSLSTFHRHNLPLQTTSFVGREQEITDVRNLLRRSRLVTLTGIGGAGKTRLSLQVAAESLTGDGDGVWFVELAASSEPNRVVQEVAQVLHLREEVGRPLLQTVVDYLRSSRLLLVLDNCEHLLDACARFCDTVLRSCPDVTILATSREPLGINGEYTYRVPSLPLPALPDESGGNDRPLDWEKYDAVRLFAERAEQTRNDFTMTGRNAFAAATICRRLDGIPLAIELAAARVRSLSVEEINARLDNRFRLLTGGSRAALPRQQTLRALIDWSYDLLSLTERTMLNRLSVFVGGWTLEAAEAVVGGRGTGIRAGTRDQGSNGGDSLTNGSGRQLPLQSPDPRSPTPDPRPLTPTIEDWEVLDLLTALVDKSLVVMDGQWEANAQPLRYRLLETVRQYALERLAESGEGDTIRDCHAIWFRDWVTQIHMTDRLQGPEQKEYLERIAHEQENLHAAIYWSLGSLSASADGADSPLWFAPALRRYWEVRGFLREGRDYVARLLTAVYPDGTDRPVTGLYVRALHAAGTLAQNAGEHDIAKQYHGRGYAAAEVLGDPELIALCLSELAIVEQETGNPLVAIEYQKRTIAINRQRGDRHHEAGQLSNLGVSYLSIGERELAKSALEEALAIERELGDTRSIAIALNNLGDIALEEGDISEAYRLQKDGLALTLEIGARRSSAYALESLAAIAAACGDTERTAQLFGAAAALRERLGAPLAPIEAQLIEGKLLPVAPPQDANSAVREQWEESLRRGHRMSLPEAAAYALTCSLPPA